MNDTTTMTPQEINRRIFEECGWKPMEGINKGWTNDKGIYRSFPHNYHGDLNAMHDAVNYGIANGLFESSVYRTYLAELEHDYWNATAAQRAEVFLRALGKWEDGE
jgi:hypothetical protein